MQNYSPGDHLYVRRNLNYTHHGIFVGYDGLQRGWVVHFALERELRLDERVEISVHATTLERFSSGDEVHVKPYSTCHPPTLVVQRAVASLKRKGYHLWSNNCEHFATWCKTGEHESEQISTAKEALWALGKGAFVGVAALAIGVVAAEVLLGDDDDAEEGEGDPDIAPTTPPRKRSAKKPTTETPTTRKPSRKRVGVKGRSPGEQTNSRVGGGSTAATVAKKPASVKKAPVRAKRKADE